MIAWKRWKKRPRRSGRAWPAWANRPPGTPDEGREPLIQAELEAPLHRAICAKAADLGALVYAVGGVEDHVHLVAPVPPRIALATLVAQIKGNSSHLANSTLGLPHSFAWQGDYGIVSFGGKQLDMVVRYVRNQHEHHRNGITMPFLEKIEAGPTI